MSTSLVYTISPYTPFTKILSANINQDKTDIQSRINWAGGTSNTTGLGDDNIQSNTVTGGGLTRSTKLKAGTANYVVINDSSGNMSQEQYLALSRGGLAADMSNPVSGDAPIYNGTSFAPAGPIPAGVTFPYVGTSAPSGYLMCDGSQVSRTTYSRLYGIIGTNYGSGDGSTTFNLPDLRGQFIRGAPQWSQTTVSYNSSTNLFTATAGFVTRSGQRITLSSSGSGVPSNLSSGTVYWTVYVSSTTFKLDTTSAADSTSASPTIPTAGTVSIASIHLNNASDIDLSRWATSTGGQSSSSLPGTEQLSATVDHQHSVTLYGNSPSPPTTLIAGTQSGEGSNGTNATSTISPLVAGASAGTVVSDNEVRPMNLSFNYIIKT